VKTLARLLRPFARRHGVRIRHTLDLNLYPFACWEEGVRVPGLEPAPFDPHLGIDRSELLLVFEDGAAPTGLIHELGHLLFDPLSKTAPFGNSFGDEFRWFGWEWVVARAFRVEQQWRDENRDYAVTDQGGAFGTLIPDEQLELLVQRHQIASELGFLDRAP
jgi:hypothetical protein